MDESAKVNNIQYSQDPAESSPLIEDGKLVCSTEESVLTITESMGDNADDKDDDILVIEGSNETPSQMGENRPS